MDVLQLQKRVVDKSYSRKIAKITAKKKKTKKKKKKKL